MIVCFQLLAQFVCPTCDIGPDDGFVFQSVALGCVGLGLFFAATFHFAVKEKLGQRAEGRDLLLECGPKGCGLNARKRL